MLCIVCVCVGGLHTTPPKDQGLWPLPVRALWVAPAGPPMLPLGFYLSWSLGPCD